MTKPRHRVFAGFFLFGFAFGAMLARLRAHGMWSLGFLVTALLAPGVRKVETATADA